MIDSVFPIELNGVKYRIATDMGEDTFLAANEPLRAPTNGVVQGESGKFQLRPDILEWKYTNFAGGEGRLVWSSEYPDQYYRGWNIDPFEVAGTLRLAKAISVTQDSTGAADFTARGRLLTAGDDLFVVRAAESALDPGVYKWDGAKWGALENWAFGTGANVDFGQSAGNSKYVYFRDSFSGIDRYLIRDGSFEQFYEPSYAPTVGFYVHTICPSLVNRYLYACEVASSGSDVESTTRVIELDTLTTTLPITSASEDIYTFEAYGNPGHVTDDMTKYGPRMCAGSNAVFVLSHSKASEAVLHRITPTTAAGAGFGEEVHRISGFHGQGLFYMNGIVYLLGVQGDRPAILYYDDVNGSYGVVVVLDGQKGSWQDDQPWVFAAHESATGSMAAVLFLTGPNGTDDEFSVMLISSITGGVATSIVRASGSVTRSDVNPTLAWYKGELFFYDLNDTAHKVLQQSKTNYTTQTGIWESSVHDMDIAEDKILLSLKLVTDPLATGTSVVVKYQLDQDGTWLTAGTHDTDDDTEKEFVISTDTTTRKFRNLQLRLELTGTASASPIVRSLRTWATVAQKVKVWQLTVDVTDEDGQAQDRSWNGEVLFQNLVTAGDSGDVISFKDGMQSRDPNDFTEYDVTIEQYTRIQRQPGEGLMRLLLKESL